MSEKTEQKITKKIVTEIFDNEGQEKGEHHAEKMMKQHILSNEIDEWHIRLDGDKMENYVYTLTIKKGGWEDKEIVTRGEDDPKFAYIDNVLRHCRHITAKAIGD